MKTIDVVFCKKGKAGSGATTAAAHLGKGLKAIGIHPRFWVITDNGRKRARDPVPFEKGMRVRISTVEDFLRRTRKSTTPPLIACAFPIIPQLTDILESEKSGVLWIHGKESNKAALEIYSKSAYPIIIVRPATVEYLPGLETQFLPHPYQPLYTKEERRRSQSGASEKEYWAVSHTRLTSVKKTDVLIGANKKLPKDKRIQLWGFDNRMYSHFTLDEKFGKKWRKYYNGELESAHLGAGTDLCSRSRYVIDLSAYRYDGGGTQYTFLEAWDAGARLVLNANWLHEKDEWNLIKGAAIWVEPTAKKVAKALQETMPDGTWKQIHQKGERLLKEHDAKRVAKMFKAYMEQL